jgi:hypothetical protein
VGAAITTVVDEVVRAVDRVPVEVGEVAWDRADKGQAAVAEDKVLEVVRVRGVEAAVRAAAVDRAAEDRAAAGLVEEEMAARAVAADRGVAVVLGQAEAEVRVVVEAASQQAVDRAVVDEVVMIVLA